MAPKLRATTTNSRPPMVRLHALVAPELHRELKLQAMNNDETLGDLLVRLITAAPAAAWNKREE